MSLAQQLFSPVVPPEQMHPIVRMMLEPTYGPERDVIVEWADGFRDRDGKFVREFQTTFESSFWELYIYAFLKDLNARTSGFDVALGDLYVIARDCAGRSRCRLQPLIGGFFRREFGFGFRALCANARNAGLGLDLLRLGGACSCQDGPSNASRCERAKRFESPSN